MNYIRGADRSQTQFLPPSLDEYVGAGCPARFIDAFVEGLDFQKLGFAHAQPAATGRPSCHPADLLKLYLYGYLNRIRSSRRLEAEAGRNLELMWLLGGLRPDFKTIADFRKDNRARFAGLFKQFHFLCRKLDLFGAELVAIDGCKFAAANNGKRHFTREQLAQWLAKTEERIQAYLSQLDQQDEQAAGAARPAAAELRDKIAQLQKRRGGYEELLQELASQGQDQISLTDPDARVMRGVHGHSLGYNVQAAVDDKHNLIVAPEVTSRANDEEQLAPMALAAKEQLAAATLSVAADKGYYSCGQLAACQQAGLTPFVPAPAKSNNGRDIFAKADFAYDAARDVYRCPAGQVLPRSGTCGPRGRPPRSLGPAQDHRRTDFWHPAPMGL